MANPRNPLRWPFSSNSIWNQPIGQQARYISANLQNAPILATDNDFFFVLSNQDSKRDLFRLDSWAKRAAGNEDTGTNLPLPDALIIPDANEFSQPNNSAALLMPDGRSLVQLNAMTRTKVGSQRLYGAEYPFPPYSPETITGKGHLGGHGGSSLSSIGGTIRIGELTNDEPIRHALKINLWAKKYLSYAQGEAGGKGYRWPAVKADSYASRTTYGGDVPEVMMGSLLAIRPWMTPQTLNLKTKAGRKLFYALRNFGAYVADDTARDAHALTIENGVAQEFEYDYGYSLTDASGRFFGDMMALFKALHVVDNNASNRIGGGGTLLTARAPSIDTSYIDDVQELLADPTVEDTFEADFNGDGFIDLLWRNVATGAVYTWLRNGSGTLIGGGTTLPLADWDWQVVDATNVDSDNRAEIVWRDRTTGAEQIWHLDDLRRWFTPNAPKKHNAWYSTAAGLPTVETLGDALNPDSPRTYEAEWLSTNNYQRITDASSGASNQRYLKLKNISRTGTAAGVFGGRAGLYKVELVHFDDPDGIADLTVKLAGKQKSFRLGVTNRSTPIRRTVYSSVKVKTGDRFTITGKGNQQDFAKIDALIFTPIAKPKVSINTTASITSQSAQSSANAALPIKEAPQFLNTVINLTNTFRQNNDLDPVVYDAKLAKAAQRHAEDMARFDFFSHKGKGGTTPLTRAERERYNVFAISENIGAGYGKPSAVMNAWKASPSHRAILLDDTLTSIGVGYAQIGNDNGQAQFTHYWTQLLATDTN